MTYKIEDNIPMIGPQNARGMPKSELRKTLEAMEIGQSFVYQSDKSQPKVSSKVCAVARTLGRKFVTRQVEDGYRIWRIK